MSGKVNPAKTWKFVITKPTDDDVEHFKNVCNEHTSWSIFSRKDDQIYGYLSFNEKTRFHSKIGSRENVEASVYNGDSPKKLKTKAFEICLTDEVVFNRNMSSSNSDGKKPTTHTREELYDWQLELVEILEEPCAWNDRTIYWRHGDVNIGKTQFAKYLCHNLGAVVIGGQHRHMLAQVQNFDAPIYVVLLSYGDEKVSYRAIEQIKDGLFTSAFGCENNKMTIRDAPHMLIIGNEPPDTEDRNYHPTKYNVARIGSPSCPVSPTPSQNIVLESGTTEHGTPEQWNTGTTEQPPL